MGEAKRPSQHVDRELVGQFGCVGVPKGLPKLDGGIGKLDDSVEFGRQRLGRHPRLAAGDEEIRLELVAGLEDQLNVEVGVMAAIPMGVKNTRDQQTILDEIEYTVPEVIGERASLFEGCWMQQCSAFQYVREHRDRQRNYEIDTLAQFDRIARYLEEQAGIEAPNPPEPGAIDHEVIAP